MIPENEDDFKEYLVQITEGKERHKYYEECEEHHEAMAVHIEGAKPDKLLEINRPHEPEDVKKYRLEVYKPVTKSLSDKVVNTVARIFNPRLYRIEFKERPSKVKKGEGLEKYLTEDYPFYINVMNYLANNGLRKMFADPNGLVMIWPDKLDVEETEYVKPIPTYIKTERLVDFEDEKYYVFLEDVPKNKPKVVCILDEMFLRKWRVDQGKTGDRTITLEYEYEHGIGTPPAFRLGGIIKGDSVPYWFMSYMSGVLPHWDKVVTMTSDLDGSIVNHLYPERWEWQVECDNSDCQGGYVYTGVIANGPNVGEKAKSECQRCHGTGKITARGPFGALTINREALAPDQTPPTPPADYITKDIEPIRELKSTIKEEEQKGFSSINMEILNKIGENQSGIAKTIDRQDLDSYLMEVSNHVFKYYLPNIVYYTAVWRYRFVLEPKEILDYLPDIHAPKEFSVLSINELMNEYKEATNTSRGSSPSAVYVRQLEEEMINIKFSNNEQKRLRNNAVIRLNPFPNKSADDLLTALSQGAIKREDWIKSNYIEILVDTAIQEDNNFLNLETVEKNKVLDGIIQRDFNIQKPMLNVSGGNGE